MNEFMRTLTESVRARKEGEAMEAAERAKAAGDHVAAAHHAARANGFHDSWRRPDFDKEVKAEVDAHLRESLSHPDPAVRQSAREALKN